MTASSKKRENVPLIAAIPELKATADSVFSRLANFVLETAHSGISSGGEVKCGRCPDRMSSTCPIESRMRR